MPKVLILPPPEPFVEAAVGKHDVYVTCSFPARTSAPLRVRVADGQLLIRFSSRRLDVVRIDVPVPVRACPVAVTTRNGVTDIRLRRRRSSNESAYRRNAAT